MMKVEDLFLFTKEDQKKKEDVQKKSSHQIQIKSNSFAMQKSLTSAVTKIRTVTKTQKELLQWNVTVEVL